MVPPDPKFIEFFLNEWWKYPAEELAVHDLSRLPDLASDDMTYVCRGSAGLKMR